MRFAATDSSGRREPAPGATEHFHFLDALRGLAALWVVLFHLSVAQVLPSVEEGGAGGFMWLTVFRRGGLGVAVFFVLSGFVIAHSLRHGLGSRRALRSFATGRLLRLTPPYWAAIVVAIVIHGLASIVNREPFAPGGGPLSVSRVFSHLVYLQGVVEDPAISEVFWTLAIEMQFYLAFAVFLIAVHLLARRWPAAFRPMVWALGALSVVGARSGVDPQLTLAPLFYSFALGAIIYWVHIARLPPLDLGIIALGLLVLAIESPSSFLNASLVTGGLLVVASVAVWAIALASQRTPAVPRAYLLLALPCACAGARSHRPGGGEGARQFGLVTDRGVGRFDYRLSGGGDGFLVGGRTAIDGTGQPASSSDRTFGPVQRLRAGLDRLDPRRVFAYRAGLALGIGVVQHGIEAGLKGSNHVEIGEDPERAIDHGIVYELGYLRWCHPTG